MSATVDETDVRAYVETSAQDCIAGLRNLTALSEYEHADEARRDIGAERIAELGLDPEAFDRYNAEEAIDELPLAVEATTTFENRPGDRRSGRSAADRMRRRPARPERVRALPRCRWIHYPSRPLPLQLVGLCRA